MMPIKRDYKDQKAFEQKVANVFVKFLVIYALTVTGLAAGGAFYVWTH